MLENFIFENHLGQRFVGLDNNVFLNDNDLRDYSWSYETVDNKISRFYRQPLNRKLALVVYAKSNEEATAVKNRLLELAEADVQAKLPGKIIVGEYYTKGYISGSVKSNYLLTKRMCNISLTFASDNPAWYREQGYSFFPVDDDATAIEGGTDYPIAYPYDYAISMNGRNIVCDAIGKSAFRLHIYGEATNPSIIIGGHTYAVNGTVKAGETLMIDSLTKTITLTTAKGEKVNWFDKRVRDNYIFEPLPPGKHIVSWLGTFGFNLTVIEERSEPRWT